MNARWQLLIKIKGQHILLKLKLKQVQKYHSLYKINTNTIR
jgi:hypothetical protein